MAEYIEREAVLEEINEKISNIAFTSPYQREIEAIVVGMERARDSVEDAPTADVAPVVRCKDCLKHIYEDDVDYICGRTGTYTRFDDFCSYGERKDGESK